MQPRMQLTLLVVNECLLLSAKLLATTRVPKHLRHQLRTAASSQRLALATTGAPGLLSCRCIEDYSFEIRR
jgi:hypothetical protein